MAMLAVIAIIVAGFITGVNTQLEIPMEYKKQYRKPNSAKPQGDWITVAIGINML